MLMKGDCMKKIGLVGGTGPESTIMYYKKLNSDIDKLTEGKTMPDIAIESVNFRKAWDYVSNNRYDLLTDYLTDKGKFYEDHQNHTKNNSCEHVYSFDSLPVSTL